MPRDSHVTILDVARAANVSRALVSFVLNGRKDVAPATRTRILQAIEELGYRPNTVARNLATRRAGAIGIVCDMETYQDPLDMLFLATILTTVSEMGQRVTLMPSDDRQIQEVAQDHAVDGIIFLDERVADSRITNLLDMGIPAVGLWDEYMNTALYKGLEELALHLESRSHQQVVCFCGTYDKLFVTKFKQTLVAILQQQGMATSIYSCSPDTEVEVAHTIARELKGATIIAASSDRLAISAIHTLHSVQLRVPDDCAVTGFGDVPAARWVQPALTTIRLPVKEIATWAVTRLLNEEETEKWQTAHKTIGSRLIVRRSC